MKNFKQILEGIEQRKKERKRGKASLAEFPSRINKSFENMLNNIGKEIKKYPNEKTVKSVEKMIDRFIKDLEFEKDKLNASN